MLVNSLLTWTNNVLCVDCFRHVLPLSTTGQARGFSVGFQSWYVEFSGLLGSVEDETVAIFTLWLL
jgi:hypothetical protein